MPAIFVQRCISTCAPAPVRGELAILRIHIGDHAWRLASRWPSLSLLIFLVILVTVAERHLYAGAPTRNRRPQSRPLSARAS